MKAIVRANVDRVVAIAVVIFGAIALVIGWLGVSGTGLAAEQIPYLVSGGLGGVVLVVVGCAVWVSADLQDEWRRLDAIEERLTELAGGHADDAGDSAAAASRNGQLPKRVAKESADKGVAV